MNLTNKYIDQNEKFGAHNYHPLPVVLERGSGVFVYDVEGKEYFDMLSAYSAINQGHCHPGLVKVIQEQCAKLALTSRGFHNDKLGAMVEKIARLSNKDKVLPMNSGAEAVETAIKLARRWGYQKKGIASNRAEIIVCDNNFHGRTTTIVGFSSDPDTYSDFGPYTPGFKSIPFDDISSLESAINKNTVAFLVEPIQGEAGVIVPHKDYLHDARALCYKNKILLIADEQKRAGTFPSVKNFINFFITEMQYVLKEKILGQKF